MKRLISKKLMKTISYLLVAILTFGPIGNLNAAKAAPVLSKKVQVAVKAKDTDASAETKTDDANPKCPADTQQCLTDTNKIANFNELVSAFNDFLATSAKVDDPNLLIQDLQAEPLPSGYAINTTTTNFEIKASGADSSTYNDLSTWFAYPAGSKTSFFTNSDPSTKNPKPNTVNCLGFDSLMTSDSMKNGGLVSNPDDMYKIIFSSSCVPDLYKLKTAQDTLIDSQSKLMNAIYKMDIKDVFYTQKELKDMGYSDLQILLATLTLKQGQTMVTDMKTGKINVLNADGISGQQISVDKDKGVLMHNISINKDTGAITIIDPKTSLPLPDYEKASFPQMPVKSQTTYGPAGSEVKILNLTNWIPINFKKLNDWINCQSTYQNNNASNCQQKVDTPSSSSWSISKLGDQFGPGFLVSTVLSLGVAYLFLRHSKGAEVKAAKDKTTADDAAKAKEKSQAEAEAKSKADKAAKEKAAEDAKAKADKAAEEKSAADEAGAKGKANESAKTEADAGAGADAPNLDVNINAPDVGGGASPAGIDVSVNIPDVSGGPATSGAPGEGLPGADAPTDPIDVPVEAEVPV